jgi:hypothetical protein
MSDLRETVIEAHGGLERWGELDAVSARLVVDGVLWAVKGQQGVLDDVFVRGKPAPRAGIASHPALHVLAPRFRDV